MFTRGWFEWSSHSEHGGHCDVLPESIIGHGFVVDGAGKIVRLHFYQVVWSALDGIPSSSRRSGPRDSTFRAVMDSGMAGLRYASCLDNMKRIRTG